ncbi:MAG TPA: hypothetical protein VIC33_16235 [Vicinamibacterales bacterium]|jgi:hypothetical protein
MLMKRALRDSLCVLAVLACLPAVPAFAQYTRSEPATGERYHVEGQIGLWDPTPQIAISSESLGILGSNIDFVSDLGIQKTRFPDLRLVLRPARKHKFRFSYIPIKYTAQATLTRDVVFNGILYRVGIPVTSTLDWKAYRFGYEYDFISRNRGFAGVIAEAKYTDIQATISSAVDTEFTHARGPIPALGGIVRVYVVPNISITGEATGFKLPASVSQGYSGKYVDIDIYGTLNFTNNIGATVGWRSLDLQYLAKTDSGDLTLRGLYFGAVARF